MQDRRLRPPLPHLTRPSPMLLRRCLVVSLLACSVACMLLKVVVAVELKLPALNDVTISLYDFSADYDPSDLSTLVEFSTRFQHTQAAYGPTVNADGSVAAGAAIVLDRYVFESIGDEYLCAPLPPVLRLNNSVMPLLPSFLNMEAEFAASGLLDKNTANRWPLLNQNMPVAGSIVFALRGKCDFAVKSYWASVAGAAALVVINTVDDRLISMPIDYPSFQAFLKQQGNLNAQNFTFNMPSVFVRLRAYPTLRSTFLRNIAQAAIFYRAAQRFIFPAGNPTNNNNANTGGQSSSSSSSSSGGSIGSSSAGSGSSSGTSFASSSSWESSSGSDGSSSGGSSDSSSASASPTDSSSSGGGDSSGSFESSSGGSSSVGGLRRLLEARVFDSPSLPFPVTPAAAGFAPPPPSRLSSPLSRLSRAATVPSGFSASDLANYTFTPMYSLLDAASITAAGTVIIVEVQPSYGGFRLAAYFLLIVPGIWLAVAVIYVIRRACQRQRARMIKAQRSNGVPTVTYKLISPAAAAAAATAPAASARMTRDSGVAEGKDAAEERDSGDSLHIEMAHLASNGHYALAGHSAAEERAPIHLSPAAAAALAAGDDDDDDDDSPSDADSARLPVPAHGSSEVWSSAAAAASSSSSSSSSTSAPPPTATTTSTLAASPSLLLPPGAAAASATAAAAAGSSTSAAAAASSSPSSSSAADDVPGVGVTARGVHVKIIGSTCAICLLDYSAGDQLKVLPCHHAFHGSCIDPWLDKSDECAVCRASVSVALELPPPCCGWCCDPPRSASSRFAEEMRERDAERRRQQQQVQRVRQQEAQQAEVGIDQARLQQEAAARVRQREIDAVNEAMEAIPVDDQLDEYGPGGGIHVKEASSASSGSLVVVPPLVLPPHDAASFAKFHVTALCIALSDLIAAIKRAQILPPRELASMQNLMARYVARASTEGRLDSAGAVQRLQRMIALMPNIHVTLDDEHSEILTDVAVTLESVLQYAAEQIAANR